MKMRKSLACCLTAAAAVSLLGRMQFRRRKRIRKR